MRRKRLIHPTPDQDLSEFRIVTVHPPRPRAGEGLGERELNGYGITFPSDGQVPSYTLSLLRLLSFPSSKHAFQRRGCQRPPEPERQLRRVRPGQAATNRLGQRSEPGHQQFLQQLA